MHSESEAPRHLAQHCYCGVSAVKVCGPDERYRCIPCHRRVMAALVGGPGFVAPMVRHGGPAYVAR